MGHWAERAWAGNLPEADLCRYWEARGPGAIKAAAASMARVSGPLGAVIHHLALIGWGMVDPWTLMDQEGQLHDLRSEAPKEVRRRVVEHVQDAAFALTVDHRPHDGGGLADGTDLTATRKALLTLAKQEPGLANLAGVAARGVLDG